MAADSSANPLASPGEEPDASGPAAPPYRVTEQVGFLLRKAHQRASAIFQDHVGDDLTPTQFAALAALLENGPLSQNLLGRVTAMDPATIQGVVSRLRARDLITRQADPQDRRRFLVTLTEAGRAIARARIPSARRVTQATLAPLTQEEETLFLSLLRRVG
ncbi:MAG TPA: MarR family transcriptional regulator [Arenibaculum sp.]|nr:MarR family transcriptional regulator [Arenibaculum sp.]